MRFTVEPSDTDHHAVICIDADLPARMTRLMLHYVEAEGRDWQHFLGFGIRPLTRDPHLDWVRRHGALAEMHGEFTERAGERCGFPALLVIRHPARTGDRDVTWDEVARENGVTISPSSMWWDLAATGGTLAPQDRFDARDDRFGTPLEGAEGLAGIGALFEVLARHTSTPEEAFGAVFETSGLAWNSYGPGPDHSVASYTGNPDARAHPQLAAVPASQICSPEVDLGRTMKVLQTTVIDAPAMSGLASGRFRGVDALWPDGREWLVVTDIDWEYSLLGCDRGTAEAVLAAEGVEAVELG
ncbi:hypothetical protein CEY15_04725 [Dietzia natronolimnaea]|uniref:Uncharacterized protein n=1 Tax=Dietzia natronolimnaea TaxID=161920 RepID=A0A2A2WT04_9ACTN|nr:hypothetical protein [Dietzia natronolimnaea]PAY24291.1 hypothetical protein CEY15_04725 [Dietzia natronolimnaea]